MEIREMLKNSQVVTYRVDFARKLKSIPAALLLQQIIYWYYLHGEGRKFYKFKAKCEHNLYADGDSFEEELFLSVKVQTKAFKTFGFNSRNAENPIKEEDAIVVSKMNNSNVPYYTINEKNLKSFLESLVNFRQAQRSSQGQDERSSQGQDERSSQGQDERSSQGQDEKACLSTGSKVVSRQDEKSCASITENTTENTTDIVIVSNEHVDEKETSSALVSKQMDEPSAIDTSNPSKYSPEFELVWSTYVTPVPTHKGNKGKASKAHIKTRGILSNDKILDAMSLYMSDDFAFGRRPCQLSTFLNGLITNTKYRDSYIVKSYNKIVTRQEGKYGKGKTAMDYYKADITLQGPLSRGKLEGRTLEFGFNLSRKFQDQGFYIGIFSEPRELWVKYIGSRYIAFKITRQANKNETTHVLFTIEELRANHYVHYHGYEWTKKLEERYMESNNQSQELIEVTDTKDIIDTEIVQVSSEISEEELFD